MQLIATQIAQEVHLGMGFDAFGDDFLAQLFAHGDDRLGDGTVVFVFRHAGDEGAVDLQGTDRKFLEVGEARVAGAKVIERQGKAIGRQLVHDQNDFFGAADEQAFGDLQLEQFARNSVAFGRIAQVIDELMVKLTCRKVNGDRNGFESAINPGADLAARRFQHPVAEFQDEPGFFGERDKFSRREHTVFGMQPADERFGTDDSSAAQADLGLIVEDQLFARQRVAKLAFELPLFFGPDIHFRAEEQVTRLVVGLHAFHRHVGKALQCGRVEAVFWIGCDADAGADMQGVRLDHERHAECSQQFFSDEAAVCALVDTDQGDDKLVAAVASQNVLIAQHATKALADLTQQFIADVMAKRVVDRGEAIEVDDQQGAMIVVAACGRQRLFDQLMEQRAIGQARQAVVVDDLLHAFLGRAKDADVRENGVGVRDHPVRVAHDPDRDRLREQFAILSPANDLALPGAGTARCRLHLRPQIGAMNAGAKQIGRLADGFAGRIAGNPGERRIDRDDQFVGVGNQDAFVAILDDA